MMRSSILSDELLRQLMAVGQVDILVGLPTFNNAASVQALVKTLHVGLAKHFPRERTVLINPDGGSDDGTLELVRNAPMAAEELRGTSTLRTTHRVSAPYHGLPDRAGGVRLVFAAADLLQARAVVIVDADLVSMSPDWVGELARPIWKKEAELVVPIHARHALDGPLLTQLVRPLLGTSYGRRLRANAAGTFGCSGRFAARMLGHPMWERDLTRPALDVWVVATAMAEELAITQVHVGPSVLAPRPRRVDLPELFEQVVGTTLTCLERDAAVWMPRAQMSELPTIGEPQSVQDGPQTFDASPLSERFRSGVRDLEPILREIVSAATLSGLRAAADTGDGAPMIADALWVNTVYEFAASAHRGVMSREHLTRALVPLYLGRAASFVASLVHADELAQRERLAALESEYETRRPYFVECWNANGRT